MGLQEQGWISDIFRGIFAILDKIIYGLLEWILQGVFDLASLTTSSGILNGIYSRIYVILGIFMAFKLSFSFFQYIINPESMGPKSEKGVGKLITRTFTMLIVLIALPLILFPTDGSEGLLARAQKALLPMVPRFVLGIEEGSGVTQNSDENIKSSASAITDAALSVFFTVPDNIGEVCSEYSNKEPAKIENLNDFVLNVNTSCKSGVNVLGFGAPKYYVYSYMLGASTIVGILLVAMLLGITIDIAKRVFKMIILEAIAPVPIMSLIDPKGSKDGAFAHWMKNLISTFIDLFLKMGLLYLVLMFISLISTNDLFVNMPSFEENPLRASYIRIILIIGLIFFAKEAPKFIKDSLGVKDSGGHSSVSGALGGLLGGIAGFAGGAASGGVLGGLTGMYTGARASASSASQGKGMQLGNNYAKIRDENAKALGITPGGIMGKAQHNAMLRQAERQLQRRKGDYDENGKFVPNLDYSRAHLNDREVKEEYLEYKKKLTPAIQNAFEQMNNNKAVSESGLEALFKGAGDGSGREAFIEKYTVDGVTHYRRRAGVSDDTFYNFAQQSRDTVATKVDSYEKIEKALDEAGNKLTYRENLRNDMRFTREKHVAARRIEHEHNHENHH